MPGVCVTGLGVLSALGNGTAEFLEGLRSARSSVGRLRQSGIWKSIAFAWAVR